MITELRNLPAPAKLNLFLHVTGRRDDGYHLLESAFELIDLCDSIDLLRRQDGLIELARPIEGIDPQTNLVLRAAQALRRFAAPSAGVTIGLRKVIPMGGGLGGGSSDAATVLLGLNRLWEMNLSLVQLAEIGLTLGADVPVFVWGRSAFGTGIGEQLRTLELPIRQYLVVQPPVSVPTARIFSAPELTRNSKPLKIEGFSRGCSSVKDCTAPASSPMTVSPTSSIGRAITKGRNDLQAVAEQLYPPVRFALEALRRSVRAVGMDAGQVRMSGSGACIFVPVEGSAIAQAVRERMNGESARAESGRYGKGRSWVVNSLARHPLHRGG
jgi:4-diphosphocytidyl-2-C-methyl-D-erythritol kinase